jgi:hypothetical protein
VQMEVASLQPRQCGVGVRNATEMVGMGWVGRGRPDT